MTAAASPKGQGEASGHQREPSGYHWRYLQAQVAWQKEETNEPVLTSKTQR